VNLLLAPFQSPVSLVAFGVSTVVVVPDDRDHLQVGAHDRGTLEVGAADHEREHQVPVHVPVHRLGVVFGVALQLVPHTGANSPYGGLGLVALFSGFFIMMGLIWAVIGE
jgi:hypothetical protein